MKKEPQNSTNCLSEQVVLPDVKHLLADSLPLDGQKAWDTQSVLAKLVEAADILLHNKDYDGHGWEEIEICYKRGKELLQQYKR